MWFPWLSLKRTPCADVRMLWEPEGFMNLRSFYCICHCILGHSNSLLRLRLASRVWVCRKYHQKMYKGIGFGYISLISSVYLHRLCSRIIQNPPGISLMKVTVPEPHQFLFTPIQHGSIVELLDQTLFYRRFHYSLHGIMKV